MRYVIKSNQPTSEWWMDQGPLIPALNVDGPKEVDTKLVDRHGNKIMRLQPPIGFGRDEEW